MSRSNWERRLPPMNGAGLQELVTEDVTTSAESFDWSADLTSVPEGYVYVEVQALGDDLYVLFSATATTAVTAKTGWTIPAGQSEGWFVDPTGPHRYIDVLAAGTSGTLKMYVSSGVEVRTDQ